jgi:hypothetical protein
MQSSSGINILFVIISVFIVFIGIAYQPLPDDFPQPWKYRFLSYWAQKIDQIVGERWVFFMTNRENFFSSGIYL